MNSMIKSVQSSDPAGCNPLDPPWRCHSSGMSPCAEQKGYIRKAVRPDICAAERQWRIRLTSIFAE